MRLLTGTDAPGGSTRPGTGIRSTVSSRALRPGR
jgi:hypothetical protein